MLTFSVVFHTSFCHMFCQFLSPFWMQKWAKKWPKIHQNWDSWLLLLPGGPKTPPRVPKGPPMAPFWTILPPQGCPRDPQGLHFGPFWRYFAPLGVTWDHYWTIFATFWNHFGSCWSQSAHRSKKIIKILKSKQRATQKTTKSAEDITLVKEKAAAAAAVKTK